MSEQRYYRGPGGSVYGPYAVEVDFKTYEPVVVLPAAEAARLQALETDAKVFVECPSTQALLKHGRASQALIALEKSLRAALLARMEGK